MSQHDQSHAHTVDHQSQDCVVASREDLHKESSCDHTSHTPQIDKQQHHEHSSQLHNSDNSKQRRVSFSVTDLEQPEKTGYLPHSAALSTQATEVQPKISGRSQDADAHQGCPRSEDQGSWREPTHLVEEISAGSPTLGTQGGEGEQHRGNSEVLDEIPHKGLQEEVRSPAVPDSDTPAEDHGQRDHSSASSSRTTSHPLRDRTSELGPHGLRSAFREHLREGQIHRCEVCSMVSGHSCRGASQLAHEALPPVGLPTGHFGSEDPGQAATGDSDSQGLQAHPEGNHNWLSPEFRVQVLRSHRRIIPEGVEHSRPLDLGRGSPGQEDPRARRSDSRDPSHACQQEQGLGHEGGCLGLTTDEGKTIQTEQLPLRTLGNKVQTRITNQFSSFLENEWDFLVNKSRCQLLEVCCSPESILSQKCLDGFGPDSAVRVAHWNGGDIETTKGRQYIKTLLEEKRPKCTWISPECGPYSPMQRLNQRTDKQKQELQLKREHARKQYEGALEVAFHAHQLGLVFVVELSEKCEGWQLQMFQDFQKKIQTFSGVCKGCQVGLRDQQGMLLGKGWKLLSNNEEIVRHLALRCTTNHPHGKCEGHKVCRQSAFYTPEFAKRVIEHLKTGNNWSQVSRELIDGCVTHGQALTVLPTGSNIMNCSDETQEEVGLPAIKKTKTYEMMESMSKEELDGIMSRLKRIHSATGHCSKEYLLRALQRRNADPKVLEVAKLFRCSVCEEKQQTKPRPTASLEDIPPKWSRLQADVGTWYHPELKKSWSFVLAIDEGSRFRIGFMFEEGKTQSIKATDFITFFENHWKPLFGNPATIRLDPAGSFRSQQLDDYFSNRGIMVEHIPAEAHWQIPLVERSIQTTKDMMSKLVSEFPEMRSHEAFSRVLWAQNTRDQYLGFSPVQHVLGRNPNEEGNLHDQTKQLPIITERGISAEFGRDEQSMKLAEELFIEQQYKNRLARASRSGSRKTDVFKPGDLVFYWRKQLAGENKKQDKQTFRSGAFLGPARVLATETKFDPAGNPQPGNVVWLFRGSRLLKAAPQQLRHASDREEAWCELQDNSPIPWTISSILDHASQKTFVDISQETPPDPAEVDWDMEEAPKQEEQEVTSRVRKAPEERPSSSTRSNKAIRMVPEPLSEDSDLLAMAASEDCPHYEDALGGVEIAIDLPTPKMAKKGFWLRDFDCFILNQVKKNHIEVNERRLSEKELEQFAGAKQKEVKNYIMAKVFAKLPQHLRPSADQVLRMRWVLTWKIDPDTQDRKAKARAVILGYQDPQYEHRPTASPTMTRTTRQLFLTICAAQKFLVEKGDVSGAFLQGREVEDLIYVEPLKEICNALDLPEGSITRLTRAAYGLVQAPLEWYLTVDTFLRSIGFERQKSDPCCWGLFDSNGLPIGFACGHVDDFLFGGREDDERWTAIKKKITKRFQWGQWESKKFTQCGVDIVQRPDFSFSLSQPTFSDQVAEIHISKEKFKNREQKTTQDEKQQMRSILGCLSWHAGQLAMELSAPVGLLLSKINTSTVEDLVEVNKLIRRAKSRKEQAILIHGLNPNDFLISAWVDAAHANRPDLSSTKGIFIGCTSSKLLDGDLDVVNPIFWCSSKITRVCRSSASAETRAAVDGEDMMYSVRFQLSEFQGHQANPWSPDETVNHTPGVLISDSKNLFDRLSQTMLTLKGAERRSDIESLCLKESMFFNNTSLRWVNGDSQLGNSLTKSDEPHQILLFHARNGRWRIVYDQSLMSGKKRKSMGLGSLEAQEAEDRLQEI